MQKQYKTDYNVLDMKIVKMAIPNHWQTYLICHNTPVNLQII